MQEQEQKRIFDAWLSQYKGLFFKVVRAYAFTPPDRDDLFQEIALQMWKSVPNFKGDAAVATWIYRVALYTAIAWRRQEKKHREGKEPLSGIEYTLMEMPPTKDRRLDWLYGQIAKLDKIDRSMMLLVLDGFSYKDMAQIIGLSESHVGVKINRIKKRLAQSSKEQDDGV